MLTRCLGEGWDFFDFLENLDLSTPVYPSSMIRTSHGELFFKIRFEHLNLPSTPTDSELLMGNCVETSLFTRRLLSRLLSR